MNTSELLDALRKGPSPSDARRIHEELYAHLRDRLLEPLRAKIQPQLRGRVDAEDILHESFLRALKGFGSFDSRSEEAFFSWVYCIGRNLIIDQARRHSAMAVPFAADSAAHGARLSRLPSRERRQETRVASEEWIAAVLSRMESDEAQIIRLHRLEERSYGEIGALLGKSPDAVKQAYLRAWRRFQEIAKGTEDASRA